jgi:hypothetical protein
MTNMMLKHEDALNGFGIIILRYVGKYNIARTQTHYVILARLVEMTNLFLHLSNVVRSMQNAAKHKAGSRERNKLF